MIFELLILLVTLGICLRTYFKRRYKYWEEKGVPFIEPQIPFGNAQNPLKPKYSSYETFRRYHEYFKSNGHKYGGLYLATSRAFLAVDPELIKNIMVKDFIHFTDHGVYFDEKNDPLSAHLFSLGGEKWRNLRAKISPTFTSGKMKMMFQTLLDCGEILQKHIHELTNNKEPLDTKDILASFTSDVIGSCAFGVEPASFSDPHSEFRENGRKALTSTFKIKLGRLCIALFPNFSKKIGVPIFDPKVTSFFLGVVKSMVKYREDNQVKRNDFMQLLLELKNGPSSEDNKKSNTDGLTLEEIAAQAFIFFLAGFETSSTTINYCLFELAQNPDVQEKLRKEVTDLFDKNDGKLTYEGIMGLKYMGQVLDETLRKYPPLPTLLRKCVKDYQVPDTDIVIENNTRLFISVLGLQTDPEYYPNPKKFDPERFSDENKASRHPFSYLPFGEGPRICIGLRFGLMQARVALALILKDYRLKLSPKTDLPLKMDPTAFLLTYLNKIWLESERIK